MANRRTRSARTSLEELIDEAPPEVLREFVRSLAAKYPDTRPMCLDTLSNHLPAGAPARADAAAAVARAL